MKNKFCPFFLSQLFHLSKVTGILPSGSPSPPPTPPFVFAFFFKWLTSHCKQNQSHPGYQHWTAACLLNSPSVDWHLLQALSKRTICYSSARFPRKPPWLKRNFSPFTFHRGRKQNEPTPADTSPFIITSSSSVQDALGTAVNNYVNQEQFPTFSTQTQALATTQGDKKGLLVCSGIGISFRKAVSANRSP